MSFLTRKIFVLLSLIVVCEAFFSTGAGPRIGCKSLFMINPKPSGFSNTKAGKVAIIERTKKNLDNSALVIAIPFEGVTKEQVDMLRKEMPKTVKASVVKNALLRQATKDTQFAPIGEAAKEENMFFFIPEGDAKSAMDAYKKWQKEVKRNDFPAKYASMENQIYTGANIEAVVNLPTKKEVITKIAQGIKAVPTKVAKGVKAVPSKLGRAFAGIRDKLDESKASA